MAGRHKPVAGRHKPAAERHKPVVTQTQPVGVPPTPAAGNQRTTQHSRTGLWPDWPRPQQTMLRLRAYSFSSFPCWRPIHAEPFGGARPLAISRQGHPQSAGMNQPPKLSVPPRLAAFAFRPHPARCGRLDGPRRAGDAPDVQARKSPQLEPACAILVSQVLSWRVLWRRKNECSGLWRGPKRLPCGAGRTVSAKNWCS